MVLGFAIAVLLALGLGLALGLLTPGPRRRAPIVEFLRAIPPPALLPFAILVIGVGDSMKVSIIAFVCLWPILLNTIDGVIGVDPTLARHDPRLRDPSRDRVRLVMLPAATPQIFAGMRTSLSLALILMVISEMVAAHERDRLLRAPVAADLRHPRDVVGDPAARDSSATCSTAASS